MPEAQTAQSKLLIGATSDPGRSGKNNEDAQDVFVVDWQDAIKLQQVQVAVVADGIGGNNAGEKASKIAIERIRSEMTADRSSPIPERLEKALSAANQDIYAASQYETNLRGMGTTVVAAAIVGSTLYVAHAGDSRAYLIRGGKIHQLTLDHTWAQEALEAGRLTPETARLHPNRNVIKRFLGIEETVDIDHSLVDIGAMPDEDNPYTASAKLDRLALQPGDRVLLCSDGLNDELSDEEILGGAQKNPPQKAAEHLVAMANAKGGRDNISVVLLQIPGPQAAAAKAGADKSRMAIIAAAAAALLMIGAGAALLLAGGGSEDPTPVATVETATPESPVAEATPVEIVVVVTATPTPTTLAPAGEATAQGTGAPPIGPAAPAKTATVDPSIPPTSTPVGVPSTPTPTTVIPTATPTSGARPKLGTPTSSTVANSVAPTDLRVTLVSPNSGDSGSGSVTFQWRLEGGTPGAGQAMELVFWQQDQTALGDGKSPTGVSNAQSVDVNFAQSGLLPPGEYKWGVLLVQTVPSYSRIKLLSEERSFRVESSGGSVPPPPTVPPPPNRAAAPANRDAAPALMSRKWRFLV